MEIPQRTPIIGVERTPILGIERLPIVGLADEPTEELQWDDIYSQLVNYIKFAAKQVAGQYETGAVNSAEDLFQEGQLLLYHCYTVYKHKAMNEFSALFKASLWRKLREIGKKEQKAPIEVDIEDAYDLGYDENVVDDIYQEYKLQEVASLLENSPIALTIFKEFVNPSTRTLWEAEMDIARRTMLQEQNYNVAVPRTVQIKGIHIQRALEITKVNFEQSFKQVKEAVTAIYRNDDRETEGLLNNLQKCV